MAKVIHTALVQNIYKKMGGSILRRRRGYSLMSRGQKPHNPRSPRQQQVRGHFNQLAGRWSSLTQLQRDMWNTHASGLDKTMSGFNDYVMMNTRLLAASYSTLVVQDTPPTTPQTPHSLQDLRIIKITNTQNLIAWQAPLNPNLYIQLYRSIEPGLSYTGKQRWTLIETAPSHKARIADTHQIPADMPIRYRIKVIDPQGRLSPPTHIESAPITARLYICDRDNHRIKEYTTEPFTYSDKFGTQGTGDMQFDRPMAVAADIYHLFIADYGNHRLKKHNRDTFALVTQNPGFTSPVGICSDENYVYLVDTGPNNIYKCNKSDLAIVDSYNVGAFEDPSGVDSDETHLFITMQFANTIHKVLKSTMTYVSEYGSHGSGNTQFDAPRDCAVDDTYLYVADSGNHRIKKHRKSDWAFIAKIGSQGTGDDQFDGPFGINQAAQYLNIADSQNNRIKAHLKTDLSFVEKAGSTGSGNEQFSSPRGIATVK